MVEFTPSQSEAIHVRGEDILVCAGAGSGKTAVLTERIVSLCADGRIPISRVLVVTFTRAAAGEMKSRIRKSLASRAQEDPFCAGQLETLDEAPVGTLHSFCKDLIRQRYSSAGLDPSARIMPETETSVLRRQVMADLFERRMASGDRDFLELLDKASGVFGIERLRDNLFSLYDFMMNQPEGADWLKEARRAAEDDLEGSRAAASLCAEMKADALAARGICFEAESYCAEREEKKRTAYFQAAGDVFAGLAAAASQGLTALSLEACGAKLARYDMRTAMEGSEDAKRMQRTAKSLFDRITGTVPFSPETFIRMHAAQRETAHALAGVLEEFHAAYSRAKSAQGALDYSDLERGALRILSDPASAEEIRSMYDAVMVDEYQDTNRVQEEILTRVARKGCLFAVGDVKQSVYRFRQADPSIFMNRMDAYRDDPQKGRLIQLSENFRTIPSLISSVNTLFSPIFTRVCGGSDYAGEGSLIATLEQPQTARPVRILLAECRRETIEEEDVNVQESETDEAYEREGLVIADEILSMIGSGLTVTDQKTGQTRAIRYSDIAVISRSLVNTHHDYEHAFNSKGIPWVTEVPHPFYGEDEITLMLAVLRLIDNMRDDLSLLCVMGSFLYGFSPDELLAVRRTLPEGRSFFDCIQNAAECGGPAGEKAAAFLDDMDRWRERSLHVSLKTLIDEIYSATNIPSVFAALEDGPARFRNLEHLRRSAGAFEKNSLLGLRSFLGWVGERMEISDTEDTPSPASPADAVRIMSVHRSKGQEFEAVIVAGVTRRFNRTDESAFAIANPAFGICAGHSEPGSGFTASGACHRAAALSVSLESTSEEMRLLYVAATRAKRYLTFTGALRSNTPERVSSSSPYVVRSMNSWWEWIACSLREAVPGFDPWSGSHSGGGFELATIRETAPVRAGTPPEQTASVPVDEEKLISLLGFEYPHSASFSVPSKLSATAMSQEGLRLTERLLDVSDPPAFARSSVSAQRAGTLTHLALEKLDYTAYAASPGAPGLMAQLDEMAACGVLTQAQRKQVDEPMILDFLESPLGGRILAAKELKLEHSFLMSIPASQVREEFAGTDDPVLVQGTIDCYFADSSGSALIDYKTDAFLTRESSQKYIAQLGVYSRAIQEAVGAEPDEVILCLLRQRRIARVVNGKLRTEAY